MNLSPAMLDRLCRIGIGVLIVASSAWGQNPSEPVRSEMLRLQKQDGIPLVQIWDSKIRSVVFETRSVTENIFFSKGSARHGEISSDGKAIAFEVCPEPGWVNPTPYVADCPGGLYLGVIQEDGSGFREYRHLSYPFGPCWSQDKSQLALTASNTREDPNAVGSLLILNLKTESEQRVDGMDAFVTSQCWSPDGKHLVYTMNSAGGIQHVWIHDLEGGTSREVASGGLATWSPDGKWIAFQDCPPSLRNCTYYAIQPGGKERKVVLRTPVKGSALWWSPDSRFVAYVTFRTDAEGGAGMPLDNVYRLRIRRLSDNSEDWVADMSEREPHWFQWIRTAPAKTP